MKDPFKSTSNMSFDDSKKSAGILDDFAVRKTINARQIEVEGDRDGSLSGSALVVNTIFGTGDTPPTASNFPTGTVYFKYSP